MATSVKLGKHISTHAWNRDRTLLAICPNTNEIHIYKVSGGKPEAKPTHVLTEHDHLVTCLDWAPNDDRLLSCSQDRNAYVWTQDGGVFKPTLVLLRINRAAISCKWSPQGNKFAVASGAKTLSICYFEEENDWWVSKGVKKHKSTVTSLAWHPSNVLIATTSTDFKCRIFTAYIKKVDAKGDITSVGDVVSEFPAKGWVHDAAWSPSGDTLAFCAHDSTLHFVDNTSQTESVVRLRGLPLTRVLFLNENSLVGVGHENKPFLFNNSSGKWELKGSIDKEETKKAAASGVSAAFAKFQSQATKGTDAKDDSLKTKHQQLITAVCASEVPQGGVVKKFTTSGLDGNLVFWDMNVSLDAAMANLKV